MPWARLATSRARKQERWIVGVMVLPECWGQEAMQTKLEGLRGWSWRNHKGETRPGGEGGLLKREAFRLLSVQGLLPIYPPPQPFFFIQQRRSAHPVLGYSYTKIDLSLRQHEAGPRTAVT